MGGEIKLSGAKNAATKMIMASLLTDEPCVLENAPNIGDVDITLDLCRNIGTKAERDGEILKLHTPKITNTKVLSLSRKNRIPILALGALLNKAEEVQVPVLGGDQIGPRPVDIHLDGLRAMGAAITNNDHHFFATAKGGLKGAHIAFRYPSVMATENILFAAVLARGKTVIENAAREPEIFDLIKMLQKMGAILELGTNRRIYVEGVHKLRGVRHRILPDRNEAASFACLALASGSDIFIKDAQQSHLIKFLSTVRKAGGEYEVKNGGIRFWSIEPLKGVEVETEVYPGFMTDWQQPFSVLLTQAHGTSIIHETVYEDRFLYTEDLNLMGADIKVVEQCLGEAPCRFRAGNYKHSAIISGPRSLRAMSIKVRDLRAGIAQIIASLVAHGQSEIDGAEEIDRGYERIDERLQALGADIKRVT